VSRNKALRCSRVGLYREPVVFTCVAKAKHCSLAYSSTVAYLGFCEGGRAKDARFEAPEAPMGWSVGRGCPLPTEEGVLVQCVQKIFVSRPKGGGHRPVLPPLNTPLCTGNKKHLRFKFVDTWLHMSIIYGYIFGILDISTAPSLFTSLRSSL